MLLAMKSLQERLRWAREKAGLSQKEVAEFIGVQQPSYSELETGETKRSKYTAELAHLLSVNAYWLATGKGSREPALDSEISQILAGASKDDINTIREVVRRFAASDKTHKSKP